MSAKSNKAVKPDAGQNADQMIDKSRRSFAKVGVVAPVIMTLVGKPVFAQVQCMSEQMSGTHSNGTESCGLGASPGSWGLPGGNIGEQSTPIAWDTATGVSNSYGTFDSSATYPNGSGMMKSCSSNGNGNNGHSHVECYTNNGITFIQLFNGQAAIFGLDPGEQYSGTMRDVILDESNQLARHLAAAMLNSLYFPNYVVKTADVIRLWNGSLVPPGGDVVGFLNGTW